MTENRQISCTDTHWLELNQHPMKTKYHNSCQASILKHWNDRKQTDILYRHTFIGVKPASYENKVPQLLSSLNFEQLKWQKQTYILYLSCIGTDIWRSKTSWYVHPAKKRHEIRKFVAHVVYERLLIYLIFTYFHFSTEFYFMFLSNNKWHMLKLIQHLYSQ
jgi:hypothetical protein